MFAHNHSFHRTTLTGPGGFEAAGSRGKVVAAREGVGSSPIPPDGFVVSVSGKIAAEAGRVLRRGVRARLEAPVRADPPLSFHPEPLLGGGPWLLREGTVESPLVGEPYAADFREKRHPRTAIGVHTHTFHTSIRKSSDWGRFSVYLSSRSRRGRRTKRGSTRERDTGPERGRRSEKPAAIPTDGKVDSMFLTKARTG